ncbi:MAG: hypothetical protein FWE02_06725 [Defluviitaleaceae bacterium]|nr:hypothetical protein [Defluviitaleaceae bacterium]
MVNYKIRFEPFEILHLETFTAFLGVNEHGVIKFSGTIAEDNEEKYIKLGTTDTEVSIYAFDMEGNEELWFKGVVTNLEIKVDIDYKTIFVTAKTGSYLMDVSWHTRTYQEPSLTYNEVLSSFTKGYPQGSFIMKKGDGTPISELIMQYKETDWSFTKRLASHFNTIVIPDYKAGGAKYYFGIKSSEVVANFETVAYTVKNDTEQYDHKIKHGVSLAPFDTIYYIAKERAIYNLGESVTINGKMLYISKIETTLEGGELYHTYYMKPLNGFQVEKCYNLQTVGASFEAEVLDVKKDVVQVEVGRDENKGGCGVRWFPYSTVYSTPDGTGWYTMPEIGDSVRMYIPTEDEAEGYVISATHLESSDSSERVNPDYKSIMNKHNKEVLFKPDELIITNNDGMSIQILDEEGIKIISDKKIVIQSEEAVSVSSTKSDVLVTAESTILLKQNETTTELIDDIEFDGAKIHLD